MRRTFAAVFAAMACVYASSGCTVAVPGRAVAGAEASQPAGVATSDDGFGVVLGTDDDAAIELFIEPQCPHCADFFEEHGEELEEYVGDDKLTVTIRPVTFLDSGSNDYSARATNAIFLVAEQDGATSELVMDFILATYSELLDTESLTDDDGLAQLANDVGVDEDTVNRIAAGEPAVDTDEVSEGNLVLLEEDYGLDPATPTVYDAVAQEDVDFSAPSWLEELVGE